MTTKEILDKLGIESLSAMQQEALQTIGNGNGDVVLLAPTGSGKTLAYLLPLCERLDSSNDNVQAIVVVPGRELAQQSQQVMQRMGTGLRSTSVCGGRPAMDEHRLMKRNRPQVVFGTPGRLNDHLAKGNINAHGVTWLVIDEFDKCLEMGFEEEMGRLLRRLPSLRRRVLLSATDAEQIPSFVELEHVQRIVADTVADESQSGQQRVETRYVKSPNRDKLDTLASLMCRLAGEKTMVFLNRREAVERCADSLQREGFMPAIMHGGMEQRLREEQLYLFANGSRGPLVCTDLASRGLDIPEVQNVIHYHLAETAQAAIHRTGRTARWMASGRIFYILGPGESLPEGVEGEELLLGEKVEVEPERLLPAMTTLYIGKGRRDKVSRGDIVGFLCKKGGLEAAQLGRIDVYDHHAYAAVDRRVASAVLKAVKGEKIKGLRTVVERMR